MYGLTRGTITLIAVAVAGALIWGATRVGFETLGEYWAVVGLLAAAGLVLALSQLLGGWTKWGWPRVSVLVFLVAFIPTLIASGWIILNAQPSPTWTQRHIHSWSHDIAIGGFVHNMSRAVVVLAFGLGLVFGFVFDTTGPRTEPVFRRRTAAAPGPAAKPAPEDTQSTTVQRPADSAPTRERPPEPGPGP
jgi:hypothetical protein